MTVSAELCANGAHSQHLAKQRLRGLRVGGNLLHAVQEVLGARLGPKQRAVLRLALSFFTWRTLVREGGLKRSAAAGAMIQAINCAK